MQEPSQCVRQALSCLALAAARATDTPPPVLTHWLSLQLSLRQPKTHAALDSLRRPPRLGKQGRPVATAVARLAQWRDAELLAVLAPFSDAHVTWPALQRASHAAFRAMRWLTLLLSAAVLSRPQA